MSTDETTLPDPQVFGPYLLLEALGRGAMGDVFLARPRDPDRGVPTPVVIKRLHGDLAQKRGFVARFRHEAEVAVAVDSPHVARVYDVGAVGDTLYIALEYVPGWPLSKVLDAVLRSGRHASVASVIDLVAGGLLGLDALHMARDASGRALDIVHRDISPKNLMVDETGRMRLIDLGLGRSNLQDWRTRTGVVMGSVGYMPPEQARGERVDARADVYAMGVVTYEMLALRNYIPRGPVPDMVAASARPVFAPPSEYRRDVPRDLDRVLARALASDRASRFSSARAFHDALRATVPPAYTEGGMASLLGELFGATREVRSAYLELLLRQPDPEGFETRPTRVFVLRPGVSQPEPEPTVATEVAAPSTAPRARPSEPISIRPSAPLPAASFGPEGTGSPLVVRRGVGTGTFIGGLVAAAALGGLVVAAALGLRGEEAAPIAAPRAQMPVPPPAAPAAAPRAVDAPTTPPPPAMPEAPPATPKRPQRARAPAPPPSPRAPAPPPPPPPDVDASLAALERAAAAVRDETADPDTRQAALKLLVDISMWKRSADEDRKAAALQKMQDRLQSLR